MLASFFLSFREGLEAALIIGVILGALQKTNRNEYKSIIWIGSGIAFVMSILIGYLFNLLGASFEGSSEEIFEGVAMFLAAGILTWVILWMKSQARMRKNKIEINVKQALLQESKVALFFLAFLAVIREGIELAIFLTATSMNSDGKQILIGAALGLVSVGIFAFLLFRTLVSLDIAKFFQVTSVILILFAAGLVAHGVHEFNEAGVIPSIVEHVWDINHILNEKATVGVLLKTLIGYNGNPSLTEVISYILYYVVLWFSSKKIIKREQKFETDSILINS